MPFYYVSGVIRNEHRLKWMDICEEKDGKQVTIATIPFRDADEGWRLARKDAIMIVEALNDYSK